MEGEESAGDGGATEAKGKRKRKKTQRQLFELKDLPAGLKTKFPTDFVGNSKTLMLNDMGVDDGSRLAVNFKKQAYWMYGNPELAFGRNQSWMEHGPELALQKLIQRGQEICCLLI